MNADEIRFENALARARQREAEDLAAAAAGVKKNPPHSPTLQQPLEENTRRVLEIWHPFF